MKKTLVITGGTSGLGLITVRTLLEKNWSVYVLARNLSKIQKLKKFKNSQNLEAIECDLSSLASVKAAVDEIKKRNLHIDVLMNNAGGFVQNLEITEDGFEKTFQMNHLGHFLLTLGLMNELLRSSAKIINVSSAAHRRGDLELDDLNYEKRKYQNFLAYCDSKLCNIYFTTELHNRYKNDGIRVFSLHPGVINTGIADDTSGFLNFMVKMVKPFLTSPEKGAETQIYLAETDRMDKYSGRYFIKKRPASVAPQAKDETVAKKLWEFSENAIKQYLK
jgi:NAD(P)-dependent dehydrogenase (short-subunit alcohol dehydrogenase family)